MKFSLTFKTPDVLDQIDDKLSEAQAEKAREFAKKYLEYSEYLTVDFDTEAKTAEVRKP